MRFDNRQFEDGVQTSLSSLDRLRRSLNLEGAARGLEAIDDAAGKCKMTPLGDAVDSVKMKFSAMQIVAVTALTNITNSVINTGKQMIKSLTVDPISDGFKEYELKMDSVQNIMNGSGESLETVMGYLEELNTYADRTIYSFSDMTSNIGKFTNSGVKLKDAVKAIQGVSNVAAISGSNTQQASHAMYNFAQALSSGSVKLIDWKSIENANMATVEFKEELLKTAVALGTVKKKGDKYVSTTKNAQGKVSGLFNATENFNESLSNQWMTTDVLVQTLGRYSDETTDIGKKAFAAAQDVKTFSQLMDTLKEAVGSGWSETWELIFGNYNEAKQLWTEVSNAVGGVINRMSKSRNALLKEWKDLDGRTALIDAFRNAIKGLLSFVKPAKDAFQEIFPAVTGKQLAALTKNLRDFTEKFKIGGKAAERLKSTFKGFFAIFDVAG
ncbi:MAG: tape measure protein, partial [Clostridia bacterium]|nr:tape measure protein [Clostridia bacterium]